MAFRRIALSLLIVAAVASACGDSDYGDSGITVDDPIGAPSDDYSYEADYSDPHRSSRPSRSNPLQTWTTRAAAAETSEPEAPRPTVLKTAAVEMNVVKNELNSAAQRVVDLATSTKVGGFLVSSVIDLDGEGSGEVVIKVPATRFEVVVSELGSIGNVRRQQLEGSDLTPDHLAAQARVTQQSRRIRNLLGQLDEVDRAEEYALRQELAVAREALRNTKGEEAYIEAQTTYSTIGISMTGKPAAPTPSDPPLERAYQSATNIFVAIASAAVIAAGVIVPIGLLLGAVIFAASPLLRRIRPRPGFEG